MSDPKDDYGQMEDILVQTLPDPQLALIVVAMAMHSKSDAVCGLVDTVNSSAGPDLPE